MSSTSDIIKLAVEYEVHATSGAMNRNIKSKNLNWLNNEEKAYVKKMGKELESPFNPPPFIADKKTWQRAKRVTKKYWKNYDEPYAVVLDVYKNMGGKIKKKKKSKAAASDINYADPVVSGDDPKAMLVDAFLGPNEEKNFQNHILNQTSNFSKVLPDNVQTVNIGAAVDGNAKAAKFLIKTNPPVSAGVQNALLQALNEDYKNKYGQYPQNRFVARLQKGDIRPPTVRQSGAFITIT